MEQRVELGVPGLDRVFSDNGIRTGSLILLVAPPGAGKTRLSMQLLSQLRPKPVGNTVSDDRPTLFLSCDEPESVLQNGSKGIWPQGVAMPNIKRLQSQYNFALNRLVEQLSRDGPQPQEAISASVEYQALARGHAVKKLFDVMARICTGVDSEAPVTFEVNGGISGSGGPLPCKYRAICIDGLLNLEEVRGVSSDERRNALYVAAQRLKNLLASAQPPLAAILTMEAGEDQETIVPQAADYLADVVIRMGVAAPMRGVRHRYLEVTKARYASTLLGEHSIRIMSADEVDRRKRTNATLGWRRALAHFNAGVVVFPRFRWRPEPSLAPLSGILSDKALRARHLLSELQTNEHTTNLLKEKLVSAIDSMVRGRALTETQKSEVRKASAELEDLILQAAALDRLAKSTDADSAIADIKELTNQICGEHPNVDGKTETSSLTCRFGIKGLDDMFGSFEGRLCPGVLQGSTTAVVGRPGTGKSTLAYCFMLSGLVEGEDVLFLSFDERHKRILRQIGGLTVERLDSRSVTLAKATAERILDPEGSASRLWFIHEHPVNTGLDELFFSLEAEVGPDRPGRNVPGARPCRLIIDSLSDLERNTPDPLVFNGFVSTLLKKVADWGVTTLFVLEAANSDEKSLDSRAMSHLADNVILLNQVHINNVSRKCIAIQKARARQHDLAAAELLYRQAYGDRLEVDVRRGFEGMSDVLAGHPKPVKVDLRLFHENQVESKCNSKFVLEMKKRFGSRIRYTPFTLTEARRAFWRQEEGKDIRPDADVTVLALDEPWVRIFALADRMGHPFLSSWAPDKADASQRWLVSQMIPRLLRQAEMPRTSDPSPQGELHSIVAVPHYLDIGLLLRREEVTEEGHPTHWENIPNLRFNTSSFETIVVPQAKKRSIPAFAFNMESMDTTACVLIEMCWNFFASQAFLHSRTDADLQCVTDALAFLTRLRWVDALPFPCNLSHMAEAMYARAWYANIPRLTGTQEGQLPFKPIPFLTSAKIFGNKPLRQNLKEFVEKRQVWVDEQLAHLHKASEKLRSYGDSNRLEAHHRYLVNSLAEEQMESEVIGIQNRLAEFESQEGAIGGWSCSGAWYLGVVSSGGNTNVGWSIVEEALDPRRVEERATLGAGLPASASFYRDHSSKEVHGLRGITFGDMQNRFFRRTRSRETVLGIGMPSEPSFLVDESLLSLCREMPEMLNDLVRRILGSERSRPSEKQPNRYKDFIRREVQQLFEAVGREEAESLVDPSAAKH